MPDLGIMARAIQSLRRYNDAYPDDQEALMALELIALRMGNFIGAQDVLASLLHTLKKDKHKEKILSDTYPIEPRLSGIILMYRQFVEAFGVIIYAKEWGCLLFESSFTTRLLNSWI